jgi:hypothetical protein
MMRASTYTQKLNVSPLWSRKDETMGLFEALARPIQVVPFNPKFPNAPGPSDPLDQAIYTVDKVLHSIRRDSDQNALRRDLVHRDTGEAASPNEVVDAITTVATAVRQAVIELRQEGRSAAVGQAINSVIALCALVVSIVALFLQHGRP